MKRDIAGRTVIVTGASAGLGRAIALGFARAGCRVGLIAREPDGLADACDEVRHAGNGMVACASADTSDYEALGAAAEKLEAELGPVDIWVNNAMETMFSRFAEMSVEDYHRLTEVTYLGVVHGTMHALDRFLESDCGHIIQIGSALTYRSIPLQSAYCGAKAAIRGFTDSLRSELIHNQHANILLTMVQMPAMNTPQFDWARTHIPHRPKPVGKIFQPEVGADAVVHAAREPKREYLVGSSTVMAVLGQTFLPGWMDRKMAKISYDNQWVGDALVPEREGNLYKPGAPALHKTHGAFDNQAKGHSWSFAATKVFSHVF